MTRVGAAPKHLTAAGRKLWREIADEIELDRAASLLLTALCEQFDRAQQAREILSKDGIISKDRFGQDKPHPACAIEVAATAAMMRAWRLLGFDQVPPGDIGRPAGS
jgi:P27 family predicted phage terminase small subunit